MPAMKEVKAKAMRRHKAEPMKSANAKPMKSATAKPMKHAKAEPMKNARAEPMKNAKAESKKNSMKSAPMKVQPMNNVTTIRTKATPNEHVNTAKVTKDRRGTRASETAARGDRHRQRHGEQARLRQKIHNEITTDLLTVPVTEGCEREWLNGRNKGRLEGRENALADVAAGIVLSKLVPGGGRHSSIWDILSKIAHVESCDISGWGERAPGPLGAERANVDHWARVAEIWRLA